MNTTFGTDRNVREETAHPLVRGDQGDGGGHGQQDAVLGNLRYMVAGLMMTLGIQRRDVVSDTWVRAYSAAFPHFRGVPGSGCFPGRGAPSRPVSRDPGRRPCGAIQDGPGRRARDDDRGDAGPGHLAPCSGWLASGPSSRGGPREAHRGLATPAGRASWPPRGECGRHHVLIRRDRLPRTGLSVHRIPSLATQGSPYNQPVVVFADSCVELSEEAGQQLPRYGAEGESGPAYSVGGLAGQPLRLRTRFGAASEQAQ